MGIVALPTRLLIAAVTCLSVTAVVDSPSTATPAERAQTHQTAVDNRPVQHAGPTYTSGNATECISVNVSSPTAPSGAIADAASGAVVTVTALAKKSCFTASPVYTLRRILVASGSTSVMATNSTLIPSTDRTWPGAGANSAYGITGNFIAPTPASSSVTTWVELSAQTATAGQQLVTAMVRVLKTRVRRKIGRAHV